MIPSMCAPDFRRFFGMLLLLAVALMGAAATASPLVGTIWDARAQRSISVDEVLERAGAARHVLLGEIHDHAEHHRIQLRILDALLARGRRPALVMEQYDLDQQSHIDAILADDGEAAQQAQRLRRLMREGWAWTDYAPLIERALAYRLPIVAANLPRTELRRRAALPSATAELDLHWNAQREAELARKVEAGHCGKLPDHVVTMVVRAQRLRDAAMAAAIRDQQATGSVAILGSGHVRRDLGVPLYLPAEDTLALGMVEIDPTTPGTTEKLARDQAVGALGERFDLLWFTLPVKRGFDPCASIPSQDNKRPPS